MLPVGSGTLYVVIPEDEPWPVGLDEVETLLRQRWPTAMVTREASAVTGIQYLSFDVELNGAARWGTYSQRTGFSLSEGFPADWADTVAWFLGLLPAGTRALAAADGNLELVPLPPSPSADEVRALYERLLEG
jgi:hypothetical protein